MLYISQNKQGFHDLVHVIPRTRPGKALSPAPTSLVNSFVQAKKAETLIKVAEGTGPLLTRRLDPGDRPVALSPSEALEGASGLFHPVDPDFLHVELYFEAPGAGNLVLDGCRRQSNDGYSTKASVRRVAASRDITLCGGLGRLEELAREADDDFLVVVEPVGNYCFARNMLSLAARAMACLSDPAQADPLGEVGFKTLRDQKAGTRYHVLPIMHNPALNNSPVISLDWLKGSLEYDHIVPLFTACRESKPMLAEMSLKGSEHVRFLTAARLCSGGYPVANRKQLLDELDTRIYIGLRQGEGEGRVLLEELVRGILAAFSELHDEDGSFLGWDFPMYNTETPGSFPLPECHSTLASLTAALAYHDKTRLLACRQCGNAMLVSPTSKKAFCSDPCRATYSATGPSQRGA